MVCRAQAYHKVKDLQDPSSDESWAGDSPRDLQEQEFVELLQGYWKVYCIGVEEITLQRK